MDIDQRVIGPFWTTQWIGREDGYIGGKDGYIGGKEGLILLFEQMGFFFGQFSV
jgi:hypothetical protein